MADGREMEQVNTIYLIRHWSELRNYKPAQSKDVVNQYHLALDASNEDSKILKTIETDTWPEDMSICLDKLHRTTSFDT